MAGVSAPSITVALLMRNEANRFLKSALKAWSSFADRIVVLDDSSEDISRQIALSCGKVILHEAEWAGAAWGAEAHPRSVLWKLALDATPPDGWIFVLDADMTPMRDPRTLMSRCYMKDADSLAFALFDLWSPTEYRSDSFWVGHDHPRIWAVKKPLTNENWQWNERGVHCGHFPLNLDYKRTIFAPLDYAILHYGYAHADLRAEKAQKYADLHAILSPQERAHAASILDPEPNLLRLPFVPELELERPQHAYSFSSEE